jgi:ABC-type Fe3+ transport system permease subunit
MAVQMGRAMKSKLHCGLFIITEFHRPDKAVFCSNLARKHCADFLHRSVLIVVFAAARAFYPFAVRDCRSTFRITCLTTTN